ncbi:hypothetical protein INT44_000931 [Umbelopsis vinacea]|uniref:AB hydrolase-1 domain-containing protein n=1 Tax=Umbelopsis vinacea TaxID=44442 RepID=A0A8H7QAD0_9FUNG|nr:hypothetical protein INT44_000931 [Umbelopsis vinacea]
MLSKVAAAGVVLIGLLLATSSGKEKPLPSLRANPSPYYPTSLYPNSTSVETPHGFIQYALFGPEEGEKIVFVHGYSCPSPIFELLSKSLAEDGYRVLTYDLWGRGYSDSPASTYNEGLYMAQLEFLIQQVGWSDTTFNVVGLSLGGAISTSYTSFRPNLVKRLILVGPAGLMSQKDVPVYTKIFDYPLLVKLWLSPIFQPLAIKALSSWASAHKGTVSAESKEAEDFAVKIALMATDQITKHSGYFRALINTAKDYPLIGLDDRYKKVGQSKTPVYALWGDADITVPFRHSQTLLQYIPQAKLFVYEGGGHNILMTNPEKAHQDILTILENRA